MKIYFDTTSNVMIVEGVGSYAPGALSATLNNERIRLWSGAQSHKDAAPRWQTVENESGDTFSDEASAFAYVQTQLAITPYLTDTDNISLNGGFF